MQNVSAMFRFTMFETKPVLHYITAPLVAHNSRFDPIPRIRIVTSVTFRFALRRDDESG